MYTCKKVLSVVKTLVPAKTEYVSYFHSNSPVTFHFPFGDSCKLQQPERWNAQFMITYSTTLPHTWHLSQGTETLVTYNIITRAVIKGHKPYHLLQLSSHDFTGDQSGKLKVTL